jgi:nucleoside-diphosphate-sugar epimerase
MLATVCSVALGFSLPGMASSGGRPSSVSAVMAAGDGGSCLIIQNKGGGHGEIGLHLAQQLVSQKEMSVTILHEGDGPNQKEAHRCYGDLDAAGVNVVWGGDLSDADACLAKLDGASFDAVVDNWSKAPELIKPYAEAAKAWGVSTYAYVSSAGMYTPEKGDVSAINEDCAKKSSGQRKVRAFIPPR